MKQIHTLRDLLIHELRNIYSAETQLIKALPGMIGAACSEDLRAVLTTHLEETEAQLDRLEEMFENLNEFPDGENSRGVKGLIEEGNMMIDEDAEDAVRDAGLIAAVQRIEHYEIAAYGTARTFAGILGEDDLSALLAESLEEERAVDEKLTELAESVINIEAAESPEVGG